MKHLLQRPFSGTRVRGIAPALLVALLAPVTALEPARAQRSSPAGSAGRAGPEPIVCADGLRDQATGGCLEASSQPAPGLLFPPPHDGGRGNRAGGLFAFVGGGSFNEAQGRYATVGGGEGNDAYTEGATISGGRDNHVGGSDATIGGGRSNAATGNLGTVGGGAFNTAASGYGYGYTTVGGGRANACLADYSTIGGGRGNTAGPGGFASYDMTIGGGHNNAVSADGATVAGGSYNTASGSKSAVGGGRSNAASADEAAVSGGAGNEAAGRAATVPGGRGNRALGDSSFAAGRRAHANHHGAFVWGDDVDADKPSSGPNQFNVYASGGVRIFSDAAATTGVTLAPGSGSWTTVSDRAAKEDLRDVDGRDVLSRLAAIPIATWSYRTQDGAIRHMGPMAQDFWSAFGLGLGPTSIDAVDADGVALAAIQGLKREKDAEIAELRAANDALRERLSRLEACSTP